MAAHTGAGISARPEEKGVPTAFDGEAGAIYGSMGSNARNRAAVQR